MYRDRNGTYLRSRHTEHERFAGIAYTYVRIIWAVRNDVTGAKQERGGKRILVYIDSRLKPLPFSSYDTGPYIYPPTLVVGPTQTSPPCRPKANQQKLTVSSPGADISKGSLSEKKATRSTRRVPRVAVGTPGVVAPELTSGGEKAKNVFTVFIHLK